MELLVDENSALAKTNLRALILDPEVWKLLSPEQVARVQKYWPGDSYNGDLSALASNDHLRHDIAQYKKALEDGQHDAEWIRQAKQATGLRNERCAAERLEQDKAEANGGEGEEGESEERVPSRGKVDETKDGEKTPNGVSEEVDHEMGSA